MQVCFAIMDAKHVCQVGAELGEGPVWVERDAALWFVDIKARRAYRWHPGRREQHFWTAPEQPGFLAPWRGGGFIAGLKTGLHRFDPETVRVRAPDAGRAAPSRQPAE